MWTPLLLIWSLTLSLSEGFSTGHLPCQSSLKPQQNLWSLFSTKRRKSSTKAEEETSILELEEPAGIVGAEFFGGNKQKAEYFDPAEEAKAGEAVQQAATVYSRFEDPKAFSTPLVAEIGQAIQEKLNSILYDEESDKDNGGAKVQYAGNLNWESCFDTKSKSPWFALEEALNFYKEVDVAVVSGKELSGDRVQLQWQVSVVWPIFWGPRVLLSGSSEITLRDGATISKQVDTLDSSSDLISEISSQLQPRFWDTYHIGMTPSAESMPRVQKRQGLLPKSYSLFEIPPRLVVSPTQLDSVGGREDGNAQVVPNHAFSCVIKTMGPQKQEYVAASPVQVQIMPSGNGQGSPPRLKWSIPISVGFQTNTQLPLPGEDSEARLESEPTCAYEFQPRRRVATLPYGGGPQDIEISDVRKKLYDSVAKDGLSPLLDANGRPQFFFLSNGVKACYTDEGLGMCVYEWRPEAVEPHEVGIELELA